MNDYLGWMAAGLTLLTFASAEPRRLRIMALTANLAFMAYGASAGLVPVLALHAALLPINLWRLLQAVRRHDRHGRTILAPGKCQGQAVRGVERIAAQGGAASAGAPVAGHDQGLVPLRGP